MAPFSCELVEGSILEYLEESMLHGLFPDVFHADHSSHKLRTCDYPIADGKAAS